MFSPPRTGSTTTILCAFSLALGALVLVPASASAAPDVQEIVDKAYCMMYYQGADAKARFSMEIYDKKKRKRSRSFTILRRDAAAAGADAKSREKDDYCGNQRFYIFFNGPADVKDSSFLVWKKKGASDKRWLYLPALDLVKRIAASDNRSSFFGSHFYYEDVSGRDLADDTHELIETTKNYYVIKSVPKKPKKVEFKYYKAWIHKKSFMPTKVEHYDKRGKLYRTLEIKKVETVAGKKTITHMRMSDTRIGGYTDLKSSKYKYNLGLPKDLFSERSLRKAPKKYLK